MRMTKLVAAIGIVSALVLAGGITAGLILARDQAPPAAPTVTEAAAPHTGSSLKADTPSNHRQQVATHADRLEREVSSQVTLDASEDNARTLQGPLEPPSVVEKNAANTAGNGAPVNGTSGGIIRKQAQYGQDAGPVIQSEPGGGPVGLPGAPADGGEDKNKDVGQGQDQALPLPEKTELKYPNLGSRLDKLVASVEEGETTAEDAAADAAVYREESVAVTIYLSGSVEDVVSFLEENGGDPRNVGEDYIEAYVPVTLLGQLSEQPGVIRVREIIPPAPGQGG